MGDGIRELLEKIKGEIEHKKEYYKRRSDKYICLGLDISLDVIDKHLKEGKK